MNLKNLKKSPQCTTQYQDGAALITAMLLAALIVILAASWLARFDTQMRITEVQRMGTQARWLLRAATDWARMIVGEDNPSYDDLTEVWAVPIAPIRMTDIAGAQEAFFSGRLQDAQARFNLYNLRPLPSTHDPATDAAQAAQFAIELAWGKALMQSTGLSQTQIEAWLIAIAAIPEAALNNSQIHVLDTLPMGMGAMSVNTELKTRLEERFIWLPERIKININTAELAILAAHPNLGEATAQHIITTRNRAPLRDINNIPNALGIAPELATQFGVNTRYFIATGRLTMGRVDLMARSLVQRQEGAAPVLLWTQAL